MDYLIFWKKKIKQGTNLKTKIKKKKKSKNFSMYVCFRQSDSISCCQATQWYAFFQLCYGLFMQEAGLLQPKICVLGNIAN